MAKRINKIQEFLDEKDIDALFGEGYELTIKKPISQKTV